MEEKKKVMKELFNAHTIAKKLLKRNAKMKLLLDALDGLDTNQIKQK